MTAETKASKVERFVAANLGNPFADAPSEPTGLEVSELTRYLSTASASDAKELLLALGHARARETGGDSADVFEPPLLTPAIAARLPRPPAAYRRIANAAGRCHVALQRLFGVSEAISRVRHAVWAACFGDSLRHALDLESVIRDHDVLILGETGTGKELVADAILSGTPGDERGGPAPHASLNAAAMPEALVESELFGHVKGAYTGATETRAGRLRSASGGCLFLDEVGELPVTTQVKLLRVIETNRVHPLGSDAGHDVDVRYVAATHKELPALVERDAFRRDLYERLAGSVIEVPPLRERPEDIPAIGAGFLARYLSAAVARPQIREVERWLRSSEVATHTWPGNVRELQNALRNKMLGLVPRLFRAGPPALAAPDQGLPPGLRQGSWTLAEVEAWYLERAIVASNGNLAEAARRLGIDRSTVRRKRRAGASGVETDP